MGNFGRKMRPLREAGISVGTATKTTERTYQPDKDYPRHKHERRENSRDEGRGRLLSRTENVFDRRLGMVMDFLWVWDNGL